VESRSIWPRHHVTAFWCCLGAATIFFLVGHSLGGLLAKQLVLVASRGDFGQKGKQFVNNLKGLVFYGVPHMGSALADSADKLLVLTLGLREGTPLLKDLKAFGETTTRLNTEFWGLRN
jgi:triacylglycerol esterase/lipase EstA (alpha/beta hydrolase family)